MGCASVCSGSEIALIHTVNIFTEYPGGELLRGIDGISTLRDELEQMVYSLVECQGDPSDAVNAAKKLETAVTKLKSDLIRQYLERRIVEAARAMDSID